MSTNKSVLIFMTGFLAWVFLVSGVFDWLNIPGFDVLLTAILGERTAFKSSLALFLAIALCTCLFIFTKKFQSKIEK